MIAELPGLRDREMRQNLEAIPRLIVAKQAGYHGKKRLVFIDMENLLRHETKKGLAEEAKPLILWLPSADSNHGHGG